MITAVKARCPEAKTDARTKEWLNEGYVKLGSVAKIVADADCVIDPAVEVYSLPDNYVELNMVVYNNKPLPEIEEDSIDKSETAETPTYFYKRGNKIGFYPRLTKVLTINIHYFKLPTPMALDNDYPDAKIPYKYHGAIVNFAIARGKESDDDVTAAKYYMGQFLQDMASLQYDVNSDNGAGVFSIGVV